MEVEREYGCIVCGWEGKHPHIVKGIKRCRNCKARAFTVKEEVYLNFAVRPTTSEVLVIN